MLTALWPLFLMVEESAVDTPEDVIVREVVEFVVVSVDTGVSVVREI